jgi:TrmH family RNA methyltransferase
MLVGCEELGLSPEALRLARAGRVSVPMAGAKRSLNVAVAFGIVMQAWFASLRHGSDSTGHSAGRGDSPPAPR